MCRIAAYLGPSISLREFLLTEPHSLYKQSWDAKEMAEAKVCADGFGFSWQYNQSLHTYRSIMPIWSDQNLETLADVLSSSLWLANVRSATTNQGLSEMNTQPFTDYTTVYLHNGFIKPFTTDTKIVLLEKLDGDIRASINGNTDSEYLLALIKQAYRQKPQLTHAISTALNWLQIMDLSAMLNVIIYRADRLYICRHALNYKCPSLYYKLNQNNFPQATIAASEKFDDGEHWQSIPEHTLLEFEAGRQITSESL